jgi:hypothetical protein
MTWMVLPLEYTFSVLIVITRFAREDKQHAYIEKVILKEV